MVDKKKDKKRVKKKKKPSFVTLKASGHPKRVTDGWRKPRGTANKQRRKRAWTPTLPSIGYRNPKETRGLRIDGMEEVLVRNLNELNALKDKKNIAVRIGGQVGKKKRIVLNDQAKQFGFKVVNFKEEAPKKKEEPKKETPNKG